MVMYGTRSLERGYWSPDRNDRLTMDLSQNYGSAFKCTVTDYQSQVSCYQPKIALLWKDSHEAEWSTAC